jgi:hypothetical protein
VARSGTAGAMEVSPTADAADDGNTTLRFAPTPSNCTGGPHGPVRPHRASPAATVSPEIGAPGWNGPRSHGRRWNVRDQSTTTDRSSLRLVPVCSACFARPRGYTQMLWRRSSGYMLFVLSLLSSSFHSHLSPIQVLCTSFVLAATALRRRRQNHPHRQPAHCPRGSVPGERPFALDDRSSPWGAG